MNNFFFLNRKRTGQTALLGWPTACLSHYTQTLHKQYVTFMSGQICRIYGQKYGDIILTGTATTTIVKDNSHRSVTYRKTAMRFAN